MQDHYPASTTRQRLGWRFWLTTLAAMVAIAVTASLGRWQLARAAQKQALQAAIDERGQQSPLATTELLSARGQGSAEALLHRSVRLRGRWEPATTVYLDNRQMYGRPGFYVITALRLEEGGASVLVQRGWVPRHFQERTQLPEIATPTGEVTVEGRIASAPSRLYEFTHAADAQGSSAIRQNLDIAAFAAETGLPLLPLSVVQTGSASDGLSRDWPAVDSGVDKHYGYAFQWFGLCALVAILYVWFQLIRRFVARPRP
ncbi:transmembrane cytochrome oxidase [Melaminivora suipulveris]|uniref:SURF1-like protein n=1 Tax=Melaminivora suipulveris TaxID=2109913 RepID=A0A2R3QE85_9BURK|nr:SURF1 family protein [Melaminivora suipulveris]AVO49984.1 transmembrane cytochrome oxidase [Melaminivora suipulveris]